MVLFSIPDKGLLFKNTGEYYLANLKVHYALYSSYQANVSVDTGSVIFQVESLKESMTFANVFSIKYNAKSSLIMKLVFYDAYRKTEAFRYVKLEGADGITNQRFLLEDTSGAPVYSNIIGEGETFRIGTGSWVFDSLWVRCYFKKFPLAMLPFRVIDDPVFDMRSDSVFRVSKNDMQRMMLEKEGIYFFQSDTNSIKGFTIRCFTGEFPMITNAGQLIEATRYITTRKEYFQLLNAMDRKAAIDKFWLEVGGQPERARDLIRSYYGRVQEANRLFTSYIEGWKTDRGMILMIFGKPNSVYRDDETEQWSYSNLPGYPDVLFLFRKMNNPFSDNDYALIRQSVYENVWYMAADQWRQGRIVNDN